MTRLAEDLVEKGAATQSGLLERTLTANAVFSGITGIELVVGVGQLSTWLGTPARVGLLIGVDHCAGMVARTAPSTTGLWALAVVTIVVSDFAAAEGLRRLRPAS